jgi:hypothetical protein
LHARHDPLGCGGEESVKIRSKKWPVPSKIFNDAVFHPMIYEPTPLLNGEFWTRAAAIAVGITVEAIERARFRY